MRRAIITSLRKTGCVVTAEEHEAIGGLGDSVANVAGRNCPVPHEYVAVQDTFGESGKPMQLLQKYGLTKENIMQAALKVIKRKVMLKKSYILAAALFLLLLQTACAPKALVYQSVQHLRMMPLSRPPILVDVQFYNPNKYTLYLSHADVNVYIDGKHLGAMQMDTIIAAPGHGSFILL